MKFQQVLDRIATSPTKLALFKMAAGKPPFLERIFGGVKNTTGVQDLTKGIVQGVTIATMGGAGALLADEVMERAKGNKDYLKSLQTEQGRQQAALIQRQATLISLAPQHDRVFKALLKDEIIGKADRATMTSAFETMKKFAPQLASDENTARSFLRDSALYATGPSYGMLKNLADAELAVAKATGLVGSR